ncbi:unnamed protein product [Urochloa humidicola]
MASDLPVDLLQDIFLRLDSTADLVRAAATCAPFRRAISNVHFRRRFRLLRRPPILGFLYGGGCDSVCDARFRPAQPPRHSAAAAHAFAKVADFEFSTLPSRRSWRVRDACDGRVLLSRYNAEKPFFDDLAIYDPLHRRHIQIPPIPSDLLVPRHQVTHRVRLPYLEPFLDRVTDTDVDKEEERLPFRVICNLFTELKVRTFVFSSVTWKWRAVASFAIGTLWSTAPTLLSRHYALSCFYWTESRERVMLVLQTSTMEFSVVNLPPESYRQEKCVFEAAEGRLGLLLFSRDVLDLYSKTWQDNGVGANDWRHDNAIPLIDNYYWSLGGAAEGYLILQGVLKDKYRIWIHSPKKIPDGHNFTVDLKTFLIERLCMSKYSTRSNNYLYASFLPPLSFPSL